MSEAQTLIEHYRDVRVRVGRTLGDDDEVEPELASLARDADRVLGGQKVHENVLSQCENPVLMRMSSSAGLAHVGSAFSSVAPGLVDRASTFEQGQALVAGRIASHPTLIRFGERLTCEGGADVTDW
ncbi:MAG: hypothetical protein WD399_07490 [Thermoleophilaceae bacterium]